MIVNTQPIEKSVRRSNGSLDIVGNPFLTIQGEGPAAGTPAVFVRTAGCVMMCNACDTNYTKDRCLWPVSDLVRAVESVCGASSLVVLTGGEPLRQGCGEFVKELLFRGFNVQIETSGTTYDETIGSLYRMLSVVCSPKAGRVHEQIAPVVSAYKYVLSNGKVDQADGLPTDVLGTGVRPARPHIGYVGEIFVQPEDDQDAVKNAANIKAAVASCIKYGHRLSLQMHKIIGLD